LPIEIGAGERFRWVSACADAHLRLRSQATSHRLARSDFNRGILEGVRTMKTSHGSAFIYGLGLLTLLMAGVAFVNVPLQEASAPAEARGAFLQRTPPPTLTEAATPNLTATLYFTQTQTAVAQTATAAATQTAGAATQTAARSTALAQTATAARQTSLAQTATAAAAQTAIAAAQTAAAQTAAAQTATALVRTSTATPTSPTATPLYTITPLISGGTVVTTAPTVTPSVSGALPTTGLPLTWVILGGVLILLAVGARYLRESSGR
jgi:hypothetical protein